MRHGIRLAIVAVAVSLGGVGCSSMEWTEELFAKRHVEVDERLRVEMDVRQQGERIDRVEVRVVQFDDRVTEARELIRNVSTPAPNAPTARTRQPEGRAARPTSEHGSSSARTLVAVVHVPIDFDRADLDRGAEAAFGAILKELRENPSLTIDLEGSTDLVRRLDMVTLMSSSE
jgi:hypothetical protein